MRTVELPGTDLRVSHICLGTGELGAGVGRDDSFALLDAFIAAGGTFLDSAHVYGDWMPGEQHRSERMIGQWLRASGCRDRVIVATKGGHPFLDSMDTPRLTPPEIAADLAESIECLGVAPIDLYFLHRDDPRQPVQAVVEALNEHVRSGRIRYFGCSNWQPERIAEANAYAAAHGLQPFSASQLFWSLAVPNSGAFPADVAVMDDVAAAYYAQAGMGVLAFTSQARGFFSKVAAGGPESLKASVRRDFESDENMRRLARAQRLAADFGTSLEAIVLAYISCQPHTSIPIVGPLTREHLRRSLADADIVLDPSMVRFLATGGS